MFDKDKLMAVPIVEVAEKLNIKTKKRGARLWMKCLWHEDKRPSMILRNDNNRCHCFACGANSDVVGLVMKEQNINFKEACLWLENEGYDIRTPEQERDKKGLGYVRELELLQCRKKSNQKETAYYIFPPDTMAGRMTMANSFAISMKKVFGANATAEVIRLYQLGTLATTGRYDDVMFPLINKQGVILDIKVQSYECDERSDRFFHSFGCYWLGGKVNKDAEFSHEALFGEHLLPLFPSKTVVLVESPKNACVGAAVYPQYLWVATGNKCMLKREVLEVLRGRKVVVYPDNDAFDEWQQKLQSMQDIALFKCEHSHDESEKGDIADYLIKQAMNKSK